MINVFDSASMKLVITRQELLELIADCNNCIMKGSYSGDSMLEAASLMMRLTELYEVLSSEGTERG